MEYNKNMEQIYSIAIDGPAGSGKSLVSKNLAKQLGIVYLSTGSIYRALGLKCKNLGLDPKLQTSAEIVVNSQVECKFLGGEQAIFLDGENVSEQIKTEQIGGYASFISQHKVIREKCVQIQREIAKKQSMVIDGRDIGSVVLPNAKYKFYLDASSVVRAKRRFDEMTQKGIKTTYDQILKEIEQRDYEDTHRVLSPLVKCSDAIVIDSSNLSKEQVVQEFLKYIRS